MIMLGCMSNGSRPEPWVGAMAAGTVSNGLAANAASAPKKVANPSSVAVAYGAISRIRWRVRKSTMLDHSDSSVTQSSSEPCCEDHGAASL